MLSNVYEGNNKITELRTMKTNLSLKMSLKMLIDIFLPILFLYLNTVIVTAGTFEP
jgi:hypothetical protein